MMRTRTRIRIRMRVRLKTKIMQSEITRRNQDIGTGESDGANEVKPGKRKITSFPNFRKKSLHRHLIIGPVHNIV